MCKLSVSSLRKGGFTAFEAEVLNYVVTNKVANIGKYPEISACKTLKR